MNLLFLSKCWKILHCFYFSFKATEDSEKNKRAAELAAETESIHSESDVGEPVDACETTTTEDVNCPTNRSEDRVVDRAEDRNFMAMLQLTPRTTSETTTSVVSAASTVSSLASPNVVSSAEADKIVANLRTSSSNVIKLQVNFKLSCY